MTNNEKAVRQINNTAAMHIAKSVFSLLIIAGSVCVAYGLYILREAPPNKSADLLIPQVRVAAVQMFTGSLDLNVTGTVVPHREVRLAAEVTGRIANRTPLCMAGSFVRTGDLLVEIDAETYELALRTSNAEVLQAEVMILETNKEIEGLRENVRLSTQQVQLLQDEVGRNQRLGDVVSRSELDQSMRGLLEAQNSFATRKNSLDTALARTDRMLASLELAKRRQERARVDLNRTRISAPFDGVVVRAMVEQDDVVQAGAVLLSVEDTSVVDVLCNLSETDLGWIQKNSPVMNQPGSTSDESGLRAAYYLPKLPVIISGSRYPEIVWQGRLDRFNGIGRDELTKATPIRIIVEKPVLDTANGPKALVRGMYVQCQLKIDRLADGPNNDELLVVPAEAVRPGGYVWMVEDQKIYHKVVEVVDNIEKGSFKIDGGSPDQSGMSVIRANGSGLKPGFSVVTSPLTQPTDGSSVIIEAGELPSDSETKSVQPTVVGDDDPNPKPVQPSVGSDQKS